MPTVTTNNYRNIDSDLVVSLSGADTWIVSLMDQYVNSASTDTLKAVVNWSSISAYEASGTGYTSGAELQNIVLSANGNTIYMDADDLTFTNLSVETYGICIRRLSDGLIMGFIDFGDTPITSSLGNIVINWNSGGILNKI
jgi:hypothetical protein